MKVIYFIVTLLLLTIFVACSEEKVETFGISNIDSTAIGEAIFLDSLGVVFNPPLNWILSPSELSSKRVIDYKDSKINPEDYKFIPSEIFFDKNNRSVLNLGKIRITKKNFSKDEAINKIVEISTSRYSSIEKKYDNFANNGIKFTRVKFNYVNWNTTKIFFQNLKGDIIQFEYTVQIDKLNKQTPLIESSLGSIKIK